MTEKTILLIGGGHAHVAVLADWIRRGRPAKAVLLTPHPTLRYSGMVPGWIAGEYDRDEGTVDLAGLARNAGAELVLDRCVRIDPVRRVVTCESGRQFAFDIASIDTGGVGQAKAILGDDPRILDVRPIDAFVEHMDTLEEVPRDIAVIGGGAGGVELAFGLGARIGFPNVTLVAGEEGLLPSHAPGVVMRVRTEMDRQKIDLIESDAFLENGKFTARGRSLEPLALAVAALGSAAPDWPRESGLVVDDAGFIAVDRYQRSTSHPHIFAAGDVAARQDIDVPHSGVHAVHTGPVLAANLRAVLAGKSPTESYMPRKSSLYLLSTGDGGAILSFGRWSSQGKWVGRLKRFIDKRWISKYAKLASGS